MYSVSASGQWTLSVLIGLPLLALATLALLAVAVVFVVIGQRMRDVPHRDFDFAPWSPTTTYRLWGAGVVAVASVLLVVSAAGYWPWNAEYHQYRAVDGTVSSVANRLVSAGDKGGSNQKFVVTLTSGQQQYGIEDTRAALLKPGDTVHLRCIRSYDYGSSNAGYDCKWGR